MDPRKPHGNKITYACYWASDQINFTLLVYICISLVRTLFGTYIVLTSITVAKDIGCKQTLFEEYKSFSQ